MLKEVRAPVSTVQPYILVVEDEEALSTLLHYNLDKEGYRVELCADGEEALIRIDEKQPDLVILDWMLPSVSGIEVCRRIRQRSGTRNLPVIMLTARGEETDRVRGLDTGADDYITKPFNMEALLARMRALLRRRPPRGSAPLRVGDLSLNADTHEVLRAERVIDLTQREFELLEYLMRNERIVISRQRLLDEVWGYDPFSTTNTIEVFVSNLRRKLEAEGEPRLLHTIRGAGYVLRA